MFGKEDFSFKAEFTMKEFLHPDALADPKGNGHQEGSQARGGIAEIAMQYAVKFQERFLIEGHQVQVGDGNAAFREAVFDGIGGEAGVVFLTGESLLLGSANDDAILHETGGAVVIKSGYTEDVHRWIPLLGEPRSVRVPGAAKRIIGS
jgi:hypothetical protein